MHRSTLQTNSIKIYSPARSCRFFNVCLMCAYFAFPTYTYTTASYILFGANLNQNWIKKYLCAYSLQYTVSVYCACIYWVKTHRVRQPAVTGWCYFKYHANFACLCLNGFCYIVRAGQWTSNTLIWPSI